MVQERAYAKINLALEVMEEKEGFHPVNNLMVPIDIYDELSFEPADTVVVADNDIEENICIRAAEAFRQRYGIKDGVCIRLNKNIPLMAGLAGGSSDAAATLRGLNTMFGIHAGIDELKELACGLGSDVPFFIEEKAALCTNRGEIVHPLNFDIPKIELLLIKPHTGLSTKAVYQSYVYHGLDRRKQLADLTAALKNKNINAVKKNIFNDLTEPALSLSSELRKLYSRLKEAGLQPFLSGSGPTMYLFAPTKEEIDKAEEIVSCDVYRKLCHTFSF